ncbi:MAG: hypothetical protein PWP31_1844 [Clostridia bacterium]|nr:hypothetical protein [Clostridia bacterium]MDK2901374.1 hypothetical protein [Thermosediminibacterales bacterium]
MSKNKNWYIPLTIVLIFLGLLLSLQFRTQKLLANSLETQKTEDLVVMWKNLALKRSKLLDEITNLQKQLSTLQATSNQGSNMEQTLSENLERLQMSSGIVPVEGPGVTVTITGDAPLLYLDLVDLVNELWASGAEAIAINEHRITTLTPIADKENGSSIYITVNNEKLLYPIVIKAIGDPHTLEKGLTFTGGLIENLSTLYNINPIIKKEENLKLPAATLSPWKYTTKATQAADNVTKKNQAN